MSAPGRLKVRRDAAGPRPARRKSTYPCMILGAGCAGLSLAWNQLELGGREPILAAAVRSAPDRLTPRSVR